MKRGSAKSRALLLEREGEKQERREKKRRKMRKDGGFLGGG